MSTRPAPPVTPAHGTADSRTRDRVVRLLLEGGPATASVLGERLGLSAAAVRRHLDALVAGGTVGEGAPRPTGGRGRPARTYRLTTAGHASMQTAYDDLALAALRFLDETAGPAAVEAFAASRVAELESRLREGVEGAAPADRAASLAQGLTRDGYAASTSATAAGSAQLCQHHCPVQSVAAQFPQLCEAETEVFSRLLGTHVQRLATLAHGDGVCTTHVPAPLPPGKPPGAGRGDRAGKGDGGPRRSPTGSVTGSTSSPAAGQHTPQATTTDRTATDGTAADRTTTDRTTASDRRRTSA